MRLFDSPPPKLHINLTPLIDILFVIIIFFFVSSRLVNQAGIGMALPTSQQGNSTKSETPILQVLANHTYLLNNKPVLETDLPEALKLLIQTTGSSSLVLNIDRTVAHGDVIRVMDDAKSSGFQKVIFGTEFPKTATK